MFSKKASFILVITVMLSLSLACVVTGSDESDPASNNEDIIATSVAATMAANIMQEESTQTPNPAEQPTITASVPEPNFNYAGVGFDFNEALAENIVAGVNPAFIDENQWWSVPEHREYRFNNWVLADSFLEANIKIYPVGDFTDINPGVGESLDTLKVVLANKPTDGDEVDVVNIFNAGQMFKSNVKYLQFQNGEGIRFLTQYGQALYPIGWPTMFYTFQGYTADGKYFISAMLPANHPALPHPDLITLDQAFADNWENYVAEKEAMLNAEADNMFMPPLGLLDEMIESMIVGEP